MKAERYVRWTSVLIGALILFLAGLWLARFFVVQANFAPIAALLLLFCLVTRKRRRNLFYVLFCALLFMSGYWRGISFVGEVQAYDEIYDQQLTYTVTATEDAVYSDRGQITFGAGNVEVNDKQLPGTINIEGFGVPAVYAGDRLLVIGSLRPARGLSQGWLNYAQLSVVERDNSLIGNLRREFAAGLQNALPEPLSSFALGLLVGTRNTLSDAVNEELVTVGLIHIVAVSGYNVTVLTNAAQKLFARRSRYQAVLAAGLLVVLFLLFTGYSPSIVRAAVVSLLSLFAWYYGRKFRPVLILLLSAAITAWVNPLYLWSSIGWYLSFTAFFGVLVLAPLIMQRLPRKLHKNIFASVTLETTAAQLCTLPIILFVFGRLSIISILANVLVVPFTPVAMLMSLFAGIGGMINQYAATLLSWPARIILDYILSITSLLSKLPFADVQVSITLWQLVVIYVMIVGVSYLLYRRSHAIILDK